MRVQKSKSHVPSAVKTLLGIQKIKKKIRAQRLSTPNQTDSA